MDIFERLGLPKPQVPQPLADLDLATLVGRSLDEAQELVEAAGGEVRVAKPGEYVTSDFRWRRVTLVVMGDQVVSAMGLS